MKKVLFVGMILGTLTLTSCKKEYVCEYPSGLNSMVVSEKDHTDAEITNLKKLCIGGNGTWKQL